MYWEIDRRLCTSRSMKRIPSRLFRSHNTVPTASTATPETGKRNDNWTTSLGLRFFSSTCIPVWLMFQLTPRGCARIHYASHLCPHRNTQRSALLLKHSYRLGHHFGTPKLPKDRSRCLLSMLCEHAPRNVVGRPMCLDLISDIAVKFGLERT
jgi:hypothetical protein